jgi:elongation factor 2
MSIANCDPNGELCMFVSKMFPNKDHTKFKAFGRVFSGTIKTGSKVRIQGGKYKPGTKIDCYVKNIQ